MKLFLNLIADFLQEVILFIFMSSITSWVFNVDNRAKLVVKNTVYPNSENKYSITLEKHDCIFLKVWPEDDDNYIIFIVVIVAGSAIVISIILVLAFYLRMKNKSQVEINENDRLIDSRTTKIDE